MIFPLLWIKGVEVFDMQEDKKKLVGQVVIDSAILGENRFRNVKSLSSWSTEASAVRKALGGSSAGISQNSYPISVASPLVSRWHDEAKRPSCSCLSLVKLRNSEQHSIQWKGSWSLGVREDMSSGPHLPLAVRPKGLASLLCLEPPSRWTYQI